MLSRLIDDIKSAPEQLPDRGHELFERGEDLRRRARKRVREIRGTGQERLWTMRVQTLEQIEDIFDKAPELPGVSTVADVAERLVHREIERVTALPIENYDALTAKKIAREVRDLGRIDLLRVRRFEAANKNRKTVLSAISRQLVKLDELPQEPVPEVGEPEAVPA